MNETENAPDPKEKEVEELVRRLHDPSTRRAARRKLIAVRAVQPLLECLQSSHESVVWAAIESLGELKAAEAVAPLVDLLERNVLVFDVTEALTAITGQDFGTDVARWRRWLGSSEQGKAPPPDTAELIRRTAELLGSEAVGSGDSYRFRLSLDEGRSQKVAVYFGRQDEQGDELVVIYSECGPAQEKYYEAVLRKNLSIPSGAFAIRDVDGTPNFVLVDTLLAASATPRILAKRIENIASRADIVEKSLTKEDRR